MVRVSGDGIKSGLLATYQSTFVVDTRGAGPGQLTVKVRGRKGTVSPSCSDIGIDCVDVKRGLFNELMLF